MSYDNFCINSLNRCWHMISKREYVDLKMAIRKFSNCSLPQRNLNNIDPKLSLKFYTDHIGSLKASKIRDLSHIKINVLEILSLKNWARDLGLEFVDLNEVFKNMYGGFTKNFKLIQFQYKLLMKISTCRYMRYKMKINRDCPNCVYCPLEMETLLEGFNSIITYIS